MSAPYRSVLALLAFAVGAFANTDWHPPFHLANHGRWRVRVPVEIHNRGTNDAAGEPVGRAVPALAGERLSSLRVCNAQGTELLFDVTDATGAQKRSGTLASDDRITVPAVCPSGSNAVVYLYAGNDLAWPVRDYLRGTFANGSFELGAETPDSWSTLGDDAEHLLRVERTIAHSGNRSVAAEAKPGASAAWVQWRQGQLTIVPGRTYTLTGWVRAQDVKGRCGWYIHVDGDKPQVVSQIASTAGGTHDWQKVTISFTAPPTSKSATLGTVLHGTGKAWFDDVTLVNGGKPMLDVTVKPAERLELTTVASVPPRFSSDWPVIATVRAFNVSDLALDPVLVMADLRPTLGRWLKIQPSAEVRVVDAESGKEVAGAVRSENTLIFQAKLAGRTVHDFQVYLARGTQSVATVTTGYSRLLASSLNKVPNASFENGDAGWMFGDERQKLRFNAGVVNNGRFGAKCISFTIPTNVTPAWSGWHTKEIPVRAGATYYLSGFLRGQEIDGSATIHAHWHTARGKTTANAAFGSTHPGIKGTTDWTQTSAFLQAPPDAASIELHLTMNSHGTVQHDGILFCEVLPGEVLNLQTAESFTTTSSPALRVSSVNPLVKVFPDDPPAPACAELKVECAQNEFEPLQIVLRAKANVADARVEVSPLAGPNGARLNAPEVHRVGYVPVDYPSSYFSSKAEDWERKVPHGAGSTDGWAGNWPDPLIPVNGSFSLSAGSNQPIWLTFRTGTNTPAGVYRGKMVVTANGLTPTTIPITVQALPFALPQQSSLRAIFDFRFGPGGGHGAEKSGPARDEWLRFIAEHRLGVDAIDPQPVFTYTNGKVSMDARKFDEAAMRCFNELGMSVAYTPHQFYMFGWAYPPRKLFGLDPFTPEWTSAFKQAYTLFTEHIRQRGWHDRFVYYISDEPHFTHDFVVEQMKKLCALIHEVDRDIPIYSSTWRHCAAWDESLDLWGVGQYGCFPVPELEQVKRAGKHFWFTCDGQMATDTPYLATERMLPYYCRKYGAGGFEFWGLAWWTYDPWQTGWHTFISQSDDGKMYYWTRYPNGDGFLTYPGKAVGVSGPISTIRLEQVREGLEDYEAMVLLTRLRDQARQNGRAVTQANAALAMASDLVTIPNAGGLRSTEILSDPDRIPAIRHAVNEAILNLMSR